MIIRNTNLHIDLEYICYPREKKQVHTCTGGSESMTLAHVNGLTIQLDIILTVNTKEGVVIQS